VKEANPKLHEHGVEQKPLSSLDIRGILKMMPEEGSLRAVFEELTWILHI
jgi:hypothetical protein